MKIFDAKNIKLIDKLTINKQQINSLDLMERAALQAFLWIVNHFHEKKTVFHIFCGVGNNGGDGLVIARMLKQNYFDVHVYIVPFSDKFSVDFDSNLERLKECNLTYDVINETAVFPDISENHIIIDAIFGIGLTHEMDLWIQKIIQKINYHQSFTISIDVPSGLFLEKKTIIAIHSDEAGKLSRLKSAASTLIGVIDGAPTIKKRVTKGKLRMSGQRACIFFMEQPEIFEATKATMKMRNGGDGVINRCLVSQFSGYVEGNALHQAKLLPEIQSAYEVKVTHFVDETLARAKSKNSERPTIKLSPQAAQFLIAHGNDVRRQCVEGFQWFHISEYATRHAERALRLAAAFHVFEYGVEGEISLDTIQRAATLCIWYVEEFARMMYEPPKVTQADLDVTTLENAILTVVHQTGVSKYRQSVLRACAANLGLTPGRFNCALAVLGGQGKIKVVVDRNTPWVIFQNHYSLAFINSNLAHGGITVHAMGSMT